jgi:hypothetical protein
VLALYAAVSGRFDAVSVEDVGTAEEELLQWMALRRPEVIAMLSNGAALSEEQTATLDGAFDEYAARVGAMLAAGEEPDQGTPLAGPAVAPDQQGTVEGQPGPESEPVEQPAEQSAPEVVA